MEISDFDEAIALSRLIEALTPFGIEVRPHPRNKHVHRLRATEDDSTSLELGVAVTVAGRADVVLWDTVRIGLRKPLSIAIAKYTSAERMFESINDRLVRALRPGQPRVRRAGSGRHRYILCPNRQAAHGFTVTVHTLISGADGARRWRCDECHYDIVVP
jgi:hypothetical protein